MSAAIPALPQLIWYQQMAGAVDVDRRGKGDRLNKIIPDPVAHRCFSECDAIRDVGSMSDSDVRDEANEV